MTTVDRLRATRDIQAVFDARTRRAGRLLVVHARDREDEAESRIAVVASRRVGGAVHRNRSKRLLREAAREMAWRDGFDVVLVARGPAAAAAAGEVTADLTEQATQLGLVQDATA